MCFSQLSRYASGIVVIYRYSVTRQINAQVFEALEGSEDFDNINECLKENDSR